MPIYRKKGTWDHGSLPKQAGARPGKLRLTPEVTSSPRRAGSFNLKLFEGPGEPEASLGKLGSRKPFAPHFLYLSHFFIKTLNDLSSCAVTGVEQHNSTSENPNISE